jgi:hypothetical protein
MGSPLDELIRLFGIPREHAERLEVIVAVVSAV